MEREKFHGRVKGQGRRCAAPQCCEAGEFRAPVGRAATSNGPGDYLYFCLEHVRAFNAGYDWFAGMTRDEIEEAQMPLAGWTEASTTWRATQGVDQPPRWSDFRDPLEAISGRFRDRVPRARTDGQMLTVEDRRALQHLGLTVDTDRATLRARYTALLRLYHPDRNGGDRSQEKKLQQVVEAYQLLRASPVFVER